MDNIEDINNEITYDEFINYINISKPYFINRWGGSDFRTCINYKKKNLNLEDSIKVVSIWNGYYDTSTDLNERKINFEKYCNDILNIYKSNILNYNACNFVKNNISYYNEYLNKSKYVCYHITNEKPDFFKYLLTNTLIGKKVLIASPFTDLISKQVAKLEYLYNISISTNFVYLKTDITYLNEDTNLYMNIPNKNFNETVNLYNKLIDTIDFDFALLSCGSYAYFIGEYIKNIGKSAFYVGGILQMWFGIFGDAYFRPYFESWFNLNYCELNKFNIIHSSKTIESCNSYLYNEYKYEHIFNKFVYKKDYLDKGLNETGSKIKLIIDYAPFILK